MTIFILHPSYPGQYINIGPYLGHNPENKVYFISKENSLGVSLKDTTLVLYNQGNKETREWINNGSFLQPAAEAVIEGQLVIQAMEFIAKEKNIKPDIIIGHTGWGSTLFCKDLYPNVPIIGFFEWYYNVEHGDVFWWPDEIPQMLDKINIRCRNSHHLLNLELCDVAVSPTVWQKSQFPERYKSDIRVIHEGIDTDFCSPVSGNRKQELVLQDLHLPVDTPIITYVSRGFEEYRGFPQFMDAIRLVLNERKDVHVVIAGVDRVCYGAQLRNSTFLKEEEKKGYPKDRVHFVGLLNRGDYQKMLRASSCHVYLTRPFILSWSFLEAMSFALPVVGSRTPPVEEVMKDEVNGKLADFRSPHHIAKKICEVLDDPENAAQLGIEARKTIVERFELHKCLRQYEDLIYETINKLGG